LFKWFEGSLSPFFSIQGNIFVCDCRNYKIRKIDVHGNVSTIAGSTKGYADGIGTQAKFNSPAGICVNDEGMLCIFL
jgi:hypothetical protein